MRTDREMRTAPPPLLKEIVCQYYEIGELVECERLYAGYENVSYVIEAGSGSEREKYWLKEYQPGRSEPEIKFEHLVVNHVTDRGFELVARPVRTRDGGTYVKLLDEKSGSAAFYAVFDLLPGEDKYSWTNPSCNDKELRDAAAVLARFHSTVFSLSADKEAGIAALLPGIAKNVTDCAARVGGTVFDLYLQENLDPILQTIDRSLRAITRQERAEMVHQVIHGDYHPGNLKFADDRVTGLFDFCWARVDARCLEVAVALTYFCATWEGPRDGEIELSKVAAFLSAYQNALTGAHECGPLGDVELECLPAMMDAGNIYVLNWTVANFCGREADPHEYLTYLQHGVHMMRWLEEQGNRDRLRRTIAGCSRLWRNGRAVSLPFR